MRVRRTARTASCLPFCARDSLLGHPTPTVAARKRRQPDPSRFNQAGGIVVWTPVRTDIAAIAVHSGMQYLTQTRAECRQALKRKAEGQNDFIPQALISRKEDSNCGLIGTLTKIKMTWVSIDNGICVWVGVPQMLKLFSHNRNRSTVNQTRQS
jgi:hypothetical protein